MFAWKHGHSMLAGFGWGMLACIAAMSSYLVWLLTYDWTQRYKRPPQPPDSAQVVWFVIGVWSCFLVGVPLTILIGR